MKLQLDKTLVKYSLYIIALATVLYILHGVISNVGTIINTAMLALKSVLSLLSPFIIALVVVYLLHPVVCWIETHVMNSKKISKNDQSSKSKKLMHTKRTVSVLLTYLLVLSILFLFVYSTYAMIGGQISSKLDINVMIDTITRYSEQYNETFQQLITRVEASGISDNLKQQLIKAAQNLNDVLGSAVGSVFDQVRRLGGNIIDIVLALVIAFYILKDLDYFKQLYKNIAKVLLSRRKNAKVRSTFHDINVIISKFIRGQLLDGLIVGVLSSAALAIVGLDFAVLIGMTAGIANIIPYFGPIIGSVPAVIIGLLSGSPIKALLAVIALVAVQQIDGALIAPKVVGESVGLHPVFVILSIIVGGAFFGLLGMLLAVPAAAIIKLFITKWVEGSNEQKTD